MLKKHTETMHSILERHQLIFLFLVWFERKHKFGTCFSIKSDNCFFHIIECYNIIWNRTFDYKILKGRGFNYFLFPFFVWVDLSQTQQQNQ